MPAPRQELFSLQKRVNPHIFIPSRTVREGRLNMPAMDAPNPVSEGEQVIRLNEDLPGIFYKFVSWLLGVVAVKNTAEGDALFKAHPTLMVALILTIVFYFLQVLAVTILQPHIQDFLAILTYINLGLGSLGSVLALIIISPTIAWIASSLWVCVFTTIAFYKYKSPENCFFGCFEEQARIWSERYKALVAVVSSQYRRWRDFFARAF